MSLNVHGFNGFPIAAEIACSGSKCPLTGQVAKKRSSSALFDSGVKIWYLHLPGVTVRISLFAKWVYTYTVFATVLQYITVKNTQI